MDIDQVVKQRLIQNESSTIQSIKKGSILRGTILKLFPKNQAQIQLGYRILTAQLEAPLQLGASYNFQVQSVDDLLHLKVFGKRVTQEHTQNIQQLKIKTTKHNEIFMDELIK